MLSENEIASDLLRQNNSQAAFRVRKTRVQSAVNVRGREVRRLEEQLKQQDNEVNKMEVEFEQIKRRNDMLKQELEARQMQR